MAVGCDGGTEMCGEGGGAGKHAMCRGVQLKKMLLMIAIAILLEHKAPSKAL